MHYLLNQEQMERLKHICTASKNFKMARELESIKPYDEVVISDGINTLAKSESRQDSANQS